RSSCGLSAASISSELKGKCTRTLVHSARSGVMSTHLLLRHSCLSPQSRSLAHVLAPVSAGGGAAACGAGAGSAFGASAFVSCLCAQPPTIAATTVNVQNTRLIGVPPSLSSRRAGCYMGPQSMSTSPQRVLDSIRRIVRLLREGTRASEDAVGLSAAQLFVLQKLDPAVPLSLTELAARTLTHQSSVSVVVSR